MPLVCTPYHIDRQFQQPIAKQIGLHISISDFIEITNQQTTAIFEGTRRKNLHYERHEE